MMATERVPLTSPRPSAGGLGTVLPDSLEAGSTTLVAHPPDVPAWILCAQTLMQQETAGGPKAVVLAAWCSEVAMRQRLADFGWNVSHLEEAGLWRFVNLSAPADDPAPSAGPLLDEVRCLGATRVAIDATDAPWSDSYVPVTIALGQALASLRALNASTLLAAPVDKVMTAGRPALDATNTVVLHRGDDAGRHYKTLEVVHAGPDGDPGEYPFTILPGEGFLVIPLRLRRAFSKTRWLREAIDGERLLFFAQPILNLHSNTVGRYEMLLRVRGDDDEIVPPSAFLGVAEQSDLISIIDRWVVAEGIHLVERLSHQSWLPVPEIEVNLSARAVTEPGLVDLIRRELERSRIDPSKMIFEITETAAVEDLEGAHDFVARVKKLGCRFALDDFGVGFSSFNHLKRLPVDYVKVDGSFVEHLADDRADQLIVKAIVDVAHGLNKQTIAEYVGDDAAMKQVRRLGMHFAQGYLVGRPKRLQHLLPAQAAAAIADR